MATVLTYNVTIAATVLNLVYGTGIYLVETEGGAASDEITSVTGMAAHHTYELRVKTAGHNWLLWHNPAGGLRLNFGSSFQTVNADDMITLRASEKGPYVVEIYRAIIPAT
jgi:hypothetical protein